MKTKRFLLFWRSDVKAQLVEGSNIADACNNAGIGAGALPALDWHAELIPPQRFPQAEFISATRLDPKHFDFDEGVCLMAKQSGDPISSIQLWKNEHGVTIAVFG